MGNTQKLVHSLHEVQNSWRNYTHTHNTTQETSTESLSCLTGATLPCNHWVTDLCVQIWKHVGRKLLKAMQTMTTFLNPLADPLGTCREPPLVRRPQFENCCFRALQKAGEEWRFMMWGGIWFQILGPQMEKARFPNWVRVLMTTAALVVEERRWRRPDSSLLNFMILLRYAGPRWLRVACITVAILNWIIHVSHVHTLLGCLTVPSEHTLFQVFYPASQFVHWTVPACLFSEAPLFWTL